VEARGLEPPNLLTASQALYQLSYAPASGNGSLTTTRVTAVSVAAPCLFLSHPCVLRLRRLPRVAACTIGPSTGGHLDTRPTRWRSCVLALPSVKESAPEGFGLDR